MIARELHRWRYVATGLLLLSLDVGDLRADEQPQASYLGTFGQINELDGGALLTIDPKTVTWGTNCARIPYRLISSSAKEVVLKLNMNSCRMLYLRLELWGESTLRVHEYDSQGDFDRNLGSYETTYARTSDEWPKPKKPRPATPSLCKTGETVVFSCFVRGKTVSLCSSPDLSKDSGRLTYRFGKAGKRPELTYPEVPMKASAAFTYAFYAEMRVDSVQVAFNIREFTYTLYYASSPADGTTSGVLVEKGSKRIAHFRCAEDTIDGRLVELYKIGEPDHKPRDLGIEP